MTESWDNIELSKTYLSISEEGGSVELTVSATEAWEFVVDDNWPEVIERDKEGNVKSTEPSWLSSNVMSGAAGETKVTFTAGANPGRELELTIKAGDNLQFVRVRQGSLAPVTATCAEVIAGPEGKNYIVTGKCTSIANTQYGNWYLNDGTGEIYVYGTIDGDGKYNWSDFNIEVGDEVTVQGSYVLYGGNTPEFVDATFIEVKKSLAKVVTESQTLPKEGGEIEVKVAYKGEGLFPTIPADYRTWISIVETECVPGEPTKIDPNPADTAVVKIAVQSNKAAFRKGSVSFVSSTSDGSSDVAYEFSQEGAILEIESGYYWMIAGDVAAAPVPSDKKYGYLEVKEATATSAPGEAAFLFTAVEGGYTIQDLSGRYYYQKGTYNNFNVSAEMPEEGHLWTLYAGDNNEVMVMNNTTNKYLQFSEEYNSWGAYEDERGLLPVFVKAIAPVVADGKYYIEVSAGVATPIAADKNYGYVNVAEKAASNAFTFAFAEGKGYTICDSNGRYYYQKGDYNSFNLSKEPTEGQYWTITPMADGTVKITNCSVGKWWQYSTNFKSFGSYAEPQDASELPKLVVVE